MSIVLYLGSYQYKTSVQKATDCQYDDSLSHHHHYYVFICTKDLTCQLKSNIIQDVTSYKEKRISRTKDLTNYLRDYIYIYFSKKTKFNYKPLYSLSHLTLYCVALSKFLLFVYRTVSICCLSSIKIKLNILRITNLFYANTSFFVDDRHSLSF
jgi:hypothetical protein